MSDKLTQALSFLRKGIAIIPLQHRSKEPESSLTGGAWEQYKTQLPTEYQVRNWLFSTWQNYGVVMGWNNLAVIDFDQWQQYALWREWFDLLNKHTCVYPQPYIVKTARGAHVYIKLFGVDANEKRIGIDIKVHGYVVGPGSIHPTGAEYTPITNDLVFPEVYSLNTFLPEDLFPRPVETTEYQLSNNIPLATSQVAGVYDPYSVVANSGGDLISKVKNTVRIESFFSRLTPTSSDGRWYSVACPFHDDHRDSGWVDVRRQLFGCQVCGFKPMDTVNLYAHLHNLNNHDAINALAKEVRVWG